MEHDKLTFLKWFNVSRLFSHISVIKVTPVIKTPGKKKKTPHYDNSSWTMIPRHSKHIPCFTRFVNKVTGQFYNRHTVRSLVGSNRVQKCYWKSFLNSNIQHWHHTALNVLKVFKATFPDDLTCGIKKSHTRTNQVNRVDISYSRNVFVPKCKTMPLQAWTGPEGSRRLRLPDFKTIGTWRW